MQAHSMKTTVIIALPVAATYPLFGDSLTNFYF